ncbi:MAG: DUF4296 domain-containing protein [Bacteroidales bacterium]|nr:DUF4296 domain-containing protein [Bacteroidales bacterium]
MKKSLPIVIISVLITAVTLFSSCTSRKAKEERKDMLPAPVMVTLLTDMYLTDGLLTVPEIHAAHLSKDSVVVYSEVLAKYGYTKEQLDKSLQYYFVVKPKKLERIYDEVLKRLTDLESEVQASMELVPVEANLWPGQLSYALPENGITDPLYFDYELSDTGLYTLNVSIVVYADDQSENPRINIWFWKPDTSAMGVSFFWNEIPLPKDGILHEYQVSAYTPDSTFTNIRGYLMNHDPKQGRWEKHSRADNIILTRKDPSIVE